MKTSFLRILIIICAVVWSIGAQAQKSIDLINDNYITSDVFVQARDTLGLTKIFKDEDPIKNGNAQIAIGYRF